MKLKPFRFRFTTLIFALTTIFTSLVSAQPPDENAVRKLPPVNYIRSRKVDIKHVAIDLRFDWDKEQAYGNTIVTLAPFNETNKINLDAAAMQITAVTLNGKPLEFKYAGGDADDNLEITLDRIYRRGEDVAVKVDYRTSYVNTADADTAIGSFGRGLRFIKPSEDQPNKPRQIWSQGETEFNRYWFPSYDSPNDFRTSELKATVDKKYTVVSNGRLVSTTDNADGTRTFYWKMDVPYANYLTSIVVAEYAEIKNGEYAGIPVIAYGYPNEQKEVADTTKNVPDMVKFFSEITGVKYAYPKYSQAMVEDFGGGMENISATTQIEEMIHDRREMLDQDSDSLQAHELAHQWFGDFVTTRDWGQIWLNESFATYFDALYNEKSKGHAEFLLDNVRGNQQAYYVSWAEGVRRPIVTKNYANKDAMFDTYAYPRGGAVLHMLRKHLGDELFFKSLNRYLTENAHQPVSTEDLRIAIEETTGESMDWFFDQWLYRMGHPIFEVAQNYDQAKKQLVLTVRQTQKINPKDEFPQVEFFQTFVDVEIDGNVQRVWIKPQVENIFAFEAATKPKIVNFDYEGTLIKELKFPKSVDELVYQAANDKDVLGRRWALGELSRIGKNPQTSAADKEVIMTAFRNALEKDAQWRLRNAAGDEIGNILAPNAPSWVKTAPIKLDDATVAVLQRVAAKDEKSLNRADALTLLGKTGDLKFANLYLAALNDQSYSVVQSAAVALGKTKSPQAYDALLKLANTDSWRSRMRIAGLSGFAALEDKRGLDLAIKLLNDKTQPGGVRTSALNVIAAAGKGDERAFPIVFDRFKKSVEANDFNGIFSGMQSFIKLGDARGQQAFDLLREKFGKNPDFVGTLNFFEQQFKAAIGK